MGQGAWSQTNSYGAQIRQRPAKMSVVTKGVESTATSLKLNWTPLTSSADIGNSAILAYEVFWDANSDTVNLLLHDDSTVTVTAERLDPGETYKFKVRARNIYGYGPFSDTVDIIPDDAPATMDAPTTTLVYPTVQIRF
jgi:hypothetical protein